MKGGAEMRHLNRFMKFDWEQFADGKDFTVTGCFPWKDYETQELLGTKVEVAITKDETDYHLKDGISSSNLMERLNFKVTKAVSIPANSKIVPINPTVKAYGIDRDGNFSSFLNCLSIQCEDVKAVC